MNEESYRDVDYSLANRIDVHEFGKKVAAAAFFPARMNLVFFEAFVSLWGFVPPPKEERGVVVPISEFASYYARSQRTRV